MSAGWWWLLPYERSLTMSAVTIFCVWWYWKRGANLPLAQRLCFWCGLLAMYVAQQTGLDYYAEHAFFVHRFQHVLLHHAGPFLIALGIPQSTLARWQSVKSVLRFAAHPWVSAALFNGLVLFWLVPAVHQPAMLDWRLYRVMNWSIAANGVLFWIAALRGAALGWTLAVGQRVAIMLAIVPVQIAIGALIFLAGRDVYPVYALCGRVFGMTAVEDQQLGGLLLWVPGAMMSVIGVLLVARSALTERRVPC